MKDPARKNRIQNLLIVLLSVSAVVLLFLGRPPLFRSDSALYRFLFPSEHSFASDYLNNSMPESVLPLRFAALSSYSDSGSIALTTGDDAFSRPGNLLREALHSAGDPAVSSEEDFLSALHTVSVYYDFLSPLPLPILCAFLNSDSSLELSARRFVLSAQNGAVLLYLTDGDCYSCCETGIDESMLRELADSYQPGNMSFACDLHGAEALVPYSLLPTELPEIPQLSAAVCAPSDDLLTLLGFNPRTNSRYESNGTTVIMEGSCTLRLLRDGTLLYDSGPEVSLRIPGEESALTEADAVLGSLRLLTSLLRACGSDAAIYPCGAAEDGDLRTLQFACQVNGYPLLCGDGEPFAQLTLDGTSVKALSLHLRCYAPLETPSLLLPLTQMLAIARQQPGIEACIGYADHGSDLLSAGWLAA